MRLSVDAAGGEDPEHEGVAVRLLADAPCVEVGEPQLVLDDPDGERFFVAGTFGAVQWFGWGQATGYRHQVGVYDRGDASCLLVVPSRWPVTSFALHRSGSILAVGTGSYDGGLYFDGELLVIELSTGRTTSLLRHPREVAALAWVDDDTLEVTVLPVDDGLGEWSDLVSEVYQIAVDWADMGSHALDLGAVGWQPVPFSYPSADEAVAGAVLADLVARTGRTWSLRRSLWALHDVGDGTLLAACEGVAAECWALESPADPQWRVLVDGTGCQLTPLTPTSVVTTVVPAPIDGRPAAGSVHQTIDIADGKVRSSSASMPATVAVRGPRSTVLFRPVQNGARTSSHDSVLMNAEGVELARLRLSGYDLFNHWFPVRYAPEALVVVGADPKPWLDKQVAVVEVRDGTAQLRELYPLGLETARQVMAGPAVYVSDSRGAAIIQSGKVYILGVDTPHILVRRSYPDGGLVWVTELDDLPTDLDEREGNLVVTTLSGMLLELDTLTGAVVRATELVVRNTRVTPLSLAITQTHGYAIGLLDGRILLLDPSDPQAA